MAAVELLCHLIDVNPSKLSKETIILLEAELFARIYDELKNDFRKQNKDYFRLLKFNLKKENTVLDSMFIRLVLTDILSTKEYSLKGIAQYTDTHEDVIQEVIDGRNTNPSAVLLRRSIDLHRSVRRDFYRSIMKKIATEYLKVA